MEEAGELSERFEYLLKPIRDLSENWQIDIAGLLKEYLEEVIIFLIISFILLSFPFNIYFPLYHKLISIICKKFFNLFLLLIYL